MARPAGVCALCQQTRELQESHFLPKALYKRLRDQSNSNPNPYVFSIKDEHQTSRQAVQYLLCSGCEQRFHSQGEDWTLGHNARDARTFPLRDLLLTGKPIKLLDELQYFRCASLPAVNADALCYFALSIIWRAAVRPWRIDNAHLDRLDVGPKYTEAIRLYLLGRAPFPEDVTLFACVSSLADVPLVCTLPESRKWSTYWSHSFTIPGITFTVNVGGRMPDYLRLACLHCGDGRPLFYTALEDLVNARDFARLATLREGNSGG